MIQKMRQFWGDKTGRWLLITFSGITLVASLCGLFFDPNGFLGNALSEVSGIFLSILIGIFVVDWYIDYQRKQQWAKFKEYTMMGLASHLCVIGSALALHFTGIDERIYGPVFEGQVAEPDNKYAEKLEELVLELKKVPEAGSNGKSKHDDSVAYYEDITWDLNQIQNVLLPRLIQIADHQELINSLAAIEDHRRNLHQNIFMHKLIGQMDPFRDVELLIGSVSKAYRDITKIW